MYFDKKLKTISIFQSILKPLENLVSRRQFRSVLLNFFNIRKVENFAVFSRLVDQTNLFKLYSKNFFISSFSEIFYITVLQLANL